MKVTLFEAKTSQALLGDVNVTKISQKRAEHSCGDALQTVVSMKLNN